ncbi:hypothetical protein [Xanthomonas sp. XNM01]|uniref:hypothetical protein n=1 Tax=Xanthomonas sp. XNM01 TaxID=2769289 RepID=UPI0017856F96|nr:hypothetical protein [Xanthomonas sp. XNM01]MBD9368387.1 hypothetical protein [Xanthomonas sp. XNM01]
MNRARLFVSAGDIAKRFRRPVLGVSPLEADVASVRVLPVAEYWIQQRIGDGDWQLKCRYGQDVEFAVARAKWWNRLLRGRRSYRVVSVLGQSLAVVFGEGAGHE